MDTFNSTFDEEDFEEVPSPFQKTKTTTARRSTVFARPMGTAPAEAPTVTRHPPGRSEQTDFLTPRRAVATTPQIEYLDEEEDEDEIEEKAVVRSRPKVKVKPKVDLLPRIGWGIVALCFLRLIFMERGVIDYLGMNGKIQEREQEISRVKHENEAIGGEIRRISLDKTYQRQLAREHLGVIAADEFLILFAGEAQESRNAADRPL